jgi:hypothetical protein
VQGIPPYGAHYLPKIKSGCRTVWTYYELGLDLGGKPNDERRNLFRRIIEHIRWPAQSIAFWPLAFVDEGKLVPDRAFFQHGLEAIGAGVIFCFGKEAQHILLPDEPFQVGQSSFLGRKVVILPGPEAMLGGSKESKRIVWHALKDFPISDCS